MLPNPTREGDRRFTPIGHRENLGNDLGIRAGEVIAIQIEERDHGQESDALVAVTVRVIPDQAKGMGCRERRQSRPGGILPFLSRAGQCGFERALVTSPGQAAVFAQLVVVNGVNDETTERVTARRELTDEEARRLRRLAEAADLFGPDHIGEDFTPMDGILETLRFRPVAGGRAAVLVTSGNRSFEDHDARRGLLGLLKTIEADLSRARLSARQRVPSQQHPHPGQR